MIQGYMIMLVTRAQAEAIAQGIVDLQQQAGELLTNLHNGESASDIKLYQGSVINDLRDALDDALAESIKLQEVSTE